jgi:hypothetical protein
MRRNFMSQQIGRNVSNLMNKIMDWTKFKEDSRLKYQINIFVEKETYFQTWCVFNPEIPQIMRSS